MYQRMFAALIAAGLLTAPLPSFAQTTAPTTTEAKKPKRAPTPGQLAARERQKKCGAEWRALSATEKAAQGPKWPQYYSKCVKRLKEQKA